MWYWPRSRRRRNISSNFTRVVLRPGAAGHRERHVDVVVDVAEDQRVALGAVLVGEVVGHVLAAHHLAGVPDRDDLVDLVALTAANLIGASTAIRWTCHRIAGFQGPPRRPPAPPRA